MAPKGLIEPLPLGHQMLGSNNASKVLAYIESCCNDMASDAAIGQWLLKKQSFKVYI